MSLAARRAQLTSRRRVGVLAAFGLAIVLADAAGAAIPQGVYATLLAWSAYSVLYVRALRPLRSPRAANLAQTIAYCTDLLLLSCVLAWFGGAWWLGPAFHALIMVVAFATVPRRFAAWVAGMALGHTCYSK